MVRPVTVAELEQYMFSLINQSRQDGGLAHYASDDTLATVARDHSNLNLKTDPKNGCPNSHQCPSEPDLGALMSNAGVTWTAWAESWQRLGGAPRVLISPAPTVL